MKDSFNNKADNFFPERTVGSILMTLIATAGTVWALTEADMGHPIEMKTIQCTTTVCDEYLYYRGKDGKYYAQVPATKQDRDVADARTMVFAGLVATGFLAAGTLITYNEEKREYASKKASREEPKAP